jgi:predicted AlkP superfamily phosphohydrolase/phosphomutase
MINEQVLSEKLKYLILMSAKRNMFNVMNVYVEFNYTDESHEKLESYDIDVKFDYEGSLEFEMYSFAHDIQRMSEKLRDVISEYIVSQDGKLINGNNSKCYPSDPLVFSIEYKVDEKHIFDLGYKFNYHDED